MHGKPDIYRGEIMCLTRRGYFHYRLSHYKAVCEVSSSLKQLMLVSTHTHTHGRKYVTDQTEALYLCNVQYIQPLQSLQNETTCMTGFVHYSTHFVAKFRN